MSRKQLPPTSERLSLQGAASCMKAKGIECTKWTIRELIRSGKITPSHGDCPSSRLSYNDLLRIEALLTREVSQ